MTTALFAVALLGPLAAQAGTQQDKMKACAQQYHQQNIAKAEYQAFMSQCLKKDSSPAAAVALTSTPSARPAAMPAVNNVTPVNTTTATAPTTATATALAAVAPATAAVTTTGRTAQQDKMKTCNAEAKSKSLAGAARKDFMKSCLSAA